MRFSSARGLSSLLVIRLWLVAAALAVLAVLLAHDAPPAQAQGLPAPDTNQMQLMHLGFYLWWDESPGATGYDIQISSQSGGTWGQWTDVSYSGTAQPAIVTGLTHATNYRWRIRATKGGTQSAWTTPIGDSRDTRTATLFSIDKANPPILHSAVAGPGQVTVTWEAGPEVRGITVAGYAVRYRWENEQGEWTSRSTDVVDADTTTLVVTGLTPGVEYQLWVHAYVGNVRGAGSRVLQAVPQMGSTTDNPGRCHFAFAGATPPGLPVITSFTPTHNSITLRWNSPTYGTQASGRKDMITNFILLVTEADNSNGQVLHPIAEAYEPAKYQQTISGLSPTTTYHVRLNARTITACYSGWSSVLVTTTANSGQRGLRLGVIERPPQEQQTQQQQDPPNQQQQDPPNQQQQDPPNQQQQDPPNQQQQDPPNQQQQDPPNQAPAVSAALGDITIAQSGTQQVTLSGVFSDADGDSLTISASSDDDAVATVSVAADHSTLTVEGVAEGTATITVAAHDTDGNQAIDEFEVTVDASHQSATVARYDTNDDGAIDPSEWWQATGDYAAEKITYSELLEVIRAYLAS
ncbi:fibronectin type III domain-containing protein [Candidatus Poriferisocius sp.]|uniref:fibronectin type III domain-containing protein n=1 Tax=Candidatus Poriferisocius sp. TaxID=3101276 RepID=UPI003B02253E